jgi:Outer membrane protein transport protein (OMPP1/FadL/TodX)
MTDYERSFQGRYQAEKSYLGVIAVQPTLSYRFNDQLSVGFGPTFNHIEGELTSTAYCFASTPYTITSQSTEHASRCMAYLFVQTREWPFQEGEWSPCAEGRATWMRRGLKGPGTALVSRPSEQRWSEASNEPRRSRAGAPAQYQAHSNHLKQSQG